MENDSEDVSEKFFKLCEGLEVGEVVATSNFRLADVMSAIELLEPKMDVGVGTDRPLELEDAIEKGLYADDFPLQVAVIDATFAMLVAWLEGSSLASTVWTNILLAEVKRMQHATFQPFAIGMNLLVRNIHAVINSVGNIEELPEDFNPQMVFMSHKWAPRATVVHGLRMQSMALTELGKSWKANTNSTRAQEICFALGARLEFIVILLEIIGSLVPPEIEDPNYNHKMHVGDYVDPESREEGDDFDDEEDDEHQFKPDFESAVYLADRLVNVTRAIAETVPFGRKSPDNVDGDFTWLPAFDAKACVRMIPACFPRKVSVPTRKEGADWFVACAQRIKHMCMVTPTTVRDLNHLFYFPRIFNLGSCVLTRSLLQICMFPTDNHLCGDPDRTVADPIEASLKNNFFPQILEKDSPVYHDMLAQNYYLTFLNHMVKLAISVYSSFGCNLSRQRDRLEMAIEELGQIQFHAGRLESRTDEVMIETKTVDEKEKNISFHSVATFVFQNLLSIIHHYFELGFRMDLFVPYEFPYVFWFMGDVEARWMLTTMERSHEIQLAVWKANPLSTTVNQRQLKERARAEEEVKKRIAINQYNMINQFAITQVCEGVVKLTVVLVKKGKIRVPPGGDAAEKLRFERRMEPFENLGPPLHVDYEMYKKGSRIDELYETDENTLIDDATANFNNARAHLEKLVNSEEMNRESEHLLHVAKSNAVACRLLKMDLADRKVEWTFTDDCPVWPCLKISK